MKIYLIGFLISFGFSSTIYRILDITFHGFGYSNTVSNIDIGLQILVTLIILYNNREHLPLLEEKK